MKSKEQNRKLATAYCRLIDNNEPIEMQNAEIEKYAQEKGIEISKWYIDDKRVNGCTSRKEFQLMLKDGKKKKFDCILVYTIDSLSKFESHVSCYQRILRQKGVEVIVVKINKGGEENEQ